MTSTNFFGEFNKKFCNMRAINAEQQEFNNLKQGTMTVTDAVRKFNQLARLSDTLFQMKRKEDG